MCVLIVILAYCFENDVILFRHHVNVNTEYDTECAYFLAQIHSSAVSLTYKKKHCIKYDFKMPTNQEDRARTQYSLSKG